MGLVDAKTKIPVDEDERAANDTGNVNNERTQDKSIVQHGRWRVPIRPETITQRSQETLETDRPVSRATTFPYVDTDGNIEEMPCEGTEEWNDDAWLDAYHEKFDVNNWGRGGPEASEEEIEQWYEDNPGMK